MNKRTDSKKAGRQPASRTHHFVPEFYLKRWCDDQNKLLAYKRHRRGFLQSPHLHPGGVGYDIGLYNFSHNDQFVLSLEETLFKQIDNDADDALTAMLDRGIDQVSEKHRWDWSLFAVSLLYRSPANMTAASREMRRLLFLPSHLSPNRYFYELGAMLAWEEHGCGPMPQNFAHFHAIGSAMIVDRHDRGMNNSIWCLIKIGTGLDRLLLSDNPVISHSPDKSLKHFSMPLSPDILLMGANNKSILDTWLAKDAREIGYNINIAQARHAEKFVFSKDRQSEDIISKFFHP